MDLLVVLGTFKDVFDGILKFHFDLFLSIIKIFGG
jgi:hypothetical protein